MDRDTDVVVVGGSVAGCATAALLGRQGIGTTVLEKSTKADHYKVVCTHYIQPGGTPVLERLGITGRLEAMGAVRNGLELWTGEDWAVLDGPVRGFNIRRAKLDPVMRDLAADTPNVEVLCGVTVTELIRDGAGRPAGVRGRTPGGETIEVRAKVVVAADGRDSDMARLARIPGRVRPHGRFGYMAYYEHLPIETGERRSLFWFRDRDVLYAFPNDDGVTVLAVFLANEKLPAFKADKERAFVEAFDGLPRRPPIEQATRISPLIGKLDMPNVRRPAAARGIAFAGDAAQSSDPLWGVGVGFALQSAEWLADELAGPLTAGTDVDDGLARYRRRHRRFMAGHHMMMSDFASGRPMNAFERTLFRAAARDRRTAALVHQVGARVEPLDRLMRPARVARALAVGVR
jgi:2-polyprenyl-6-methoxyphenol hydroxylase-like FAD-dependent oxidoreductase